MCVQRLRFVLFTSCVLAACAHEIESPPPTLSLVAPDLVCNGTSVSGANGITSVSLAGTDFTPMPSRTLSDRRELVLPKVQLGPVAAVPGGILAAAPIEISDDPAKPQASRVHWTSETSMSFDVAPDDMLPTGVFDVTVTNPDGSHASKLSQVLAIVPPPIVTAAQPMAICDDQSNQTVVVTGTSFLVYDGASPTITISAPTPRTYPSTFAAADCTPIPGNFAEHNVELCTAITFTIPQGDIAVTANTMLALVVTNPAPADCSSSTSFTVTLDAPPHVDSVVPATMCQGGGQITVNGSNFAPGAVVTEHCPTVTITAATVDVNSDGTQLVATFGGGASVGACEVIVTNPDGCEDRPLPHKTVNVTTGPIAFFTDPAVVFNGINTRMTIYATTISQPLPANAVTITMGGTSTQLQFNTVVGHPNRLQAIVPKNQVPGVYDLTLEDNVHCPSTLPMAFTVTATATVTLKNLVPPFGATASDTAVTIFRDTAALAPNNHPFVVTPRVFLNPHNPAPTDIAVPLEEVAFLDGDRATGIVPAGTPAHLYDVVLVNPDGTVGVLDSGYTETTAAPPAIDNVTPASIVDATGQSVMLSGTSFASGDLVSLTCVDPLNNTVSPAAVAGTVSCTSGACTQPITINGSALMAGSVCVVRVTNPDGTYGEFSAIGVTNSSFNLNNPRPGPNMTVGRRALSAAAGKATSANRFVYAIGGDAGTAPGALSSVELAPVDLFGRIGAFSIQPPSLRAPRTLAGAVTVGRYIYLAGGNNGAGPVNTAERALILSPRETPEVTDVDLQLAAVGLDAGTYHYRVSAVFSATDSDNPGGESLASDEFTIRVPIFPNKKVALTLVWRAPVDTLGNPLLGVSGYRIYRTAKDGTPGTEVLYATTSSTQLTLVDDGTATAGTAVPLPLGTTGTWAALPNLGTNREGLALAWARDPVTAGMFHVYALLGRSTVTTANTSYEFLTVTTAPNGRQTAGASWTAGVLPSAQGRWQLGAWTVDASVSSLYTPPTTYVFLGGGQTATGTAANKVEAGLVTAGGQLANTSIVTPTTLDDSPKDFAAAESGYGVCAANGQLFSFGGLGGMPTAGAQSAPLTSPAPSVSNNAWNSEGLMMTHGRYLLGSSVQSAFIFLLGGTTNEPSAASKTTELVIW